MKDFRLYKDEVLAELSNVLNDVSDAAVEELAKAILTVRRVFVGGVGRSGFMMRCFAMRLMHLGKETYFLGETITPSASGEDLVLLGSGSGKTPSLVARAQKARQLNSKIGLITISRNCPLGEMADFVVEIPAPSSKVETNYISIQPMGNLFEQSLLLTGDIIIMKLMEKTGMTSKKMFENHANLE